MHNTNAPINTSLTHRRAGILLHISSLPGGEGDFGQQAYNFVDFLHNTGVTLWQTLPLGIPHDNGSPYQCLSSHAGNPAFISVQWLIDKGWLRPTKQNQPDNTLSKSHLLAQSFIDFQSFASHQDLQRFKQFCLDKADWLTHFSVFFALKQTTHHSCWNQWHEPLKNNNPAAIEEVCVRLQPLITEVQYQQFIFFTQWAELKRYAQHKNILLFGDIPIFVAYDSADVWANRQVFKLDEQGNMPTVTGVPPDYFSTTGQRWGNPHYDWQYLQQTDFKWWIARIATQSELFDVVRLDHFRGLESAWEIPANETTAINGQWVAAPGKALLNALKKACPTIALVAEDLGVITQQVRALRDDFNLPGMNILQFAFDGNSDNCYLPHRHLQSSVVYTGTHDNNTTLGWFDTLNDHEKHRVYEYLGFSRATMPFALIATALASVANLAIIPMQDILELNADHRMNIPGTCDGNWTWRFEWQQLTEASIKQLSHLIRLYGR